MSGTSYSRIAVLDIGKTNAKVVVIDSKTGAELAARRMPNRVLAAPPYPHYDIDGLWAFILESLAVFAASPGFDAVSITTHGASAALTNDRGDLALPVLDYEHDYPDDIRAAYDAMRPPFRETYSPRLAMGLNLGAQLHYQKTAFPDMFAQVRSILTYPQYWAFCLTGVAAGEVTSLGCHTDLWETAEGRYSSLVDRLDIRDLMAPIRPAFDRLGNISPGIAASLSLQNEASVYCGIHDSNASLLPHLLRRPAPFSVVSTGTWVVSFAVGASLSRLDAARDMLANTNTNAYGAPVPSARFMGGREFEMLIAGLQAPGEEEAYAAARAVITRGTMLLPNVVEGSGPFPGRKMSWVGTPENDAERHACASLYIALMTAACLDLLGADGPVVIEGPFSQNLIFLDAIASIIRRPVMLQGGGLSTGTADGAALLTGMPPVIAEETGVVGTLDIGGYAATWARLVG